MSAESPIVQAYIFDWLNVAVAVSICYDYGLTLGHEIEYVWKSQWSFVNILFYTFRYSAMLSTIPIILDVAHPTDWQNSDVQCTATTWTQLVLGFASSTSAAIFSAMRVYAMTNRSLWLSLVILAFALVYPAIVGYALIISEPASVVVAAPTARSCSSSVRNFARWTRWMMGSRASSVVSDGLILLITWFQTRQSTSQDERLGQRPTITNVLMKDTAIYFGILFVLNVLGIAVGRIKPGDADILFAAWIPLITAIILSRLLLHLRKMSSDDEGEELLSQSLFVTFAAIKAGPTKLLYELAFPFPKLGFENAISDHALPSGG
ncbi:hypothetical protein WOLCODRAFT_145771 [Wolfiporia cocos MD-104 SS10]|uniref:DUF6533 domain-containing protein n=1 Tax=Wolfiporia cocos (strain MD-104) TaxID=742152 RepID=A0A2H3JH55_WOLCO|nr:hypothetical protein WOLCODRAFT_145771 [Wolfiporia cocos MD-104 SS10]